MYSSPSAALCDREEDVHSSCESHPRDRLIILSQQWESFNADFPQQFPVLLLVFLQRRAYSSRSFRQVLHTMSNDDDLRSFVPKGMKQVTVGRETISMYNVEQINCPTIPGPEKTYAYHQNKLNLEASALNYQAKIQTLASSTGCTSLANVLRAHWNRVANAAYRMAGQITGVSYHGRNGVILDDATTDESKVPSAEPCDSATKRRTFPDPPSR